MAAKTAKTSLEEVMQEYGEEVRHRVIGMVDDHVLLVVYTMDSLAQWRKENGYFGAQIAD